MVKVKTKMQYSDVRLREQNLVKNTGIMLLSGLWKLYFEHVEITEQTKKLYDTMTAS